MASTLKSSKEKIKNQNVKLVPSKVEGCKIEEVVPKGLRNFDF